MLNAAGRVPKDSGAFFVECDGKTGDWEGEQP